MINYNADSELRLPPPLPRPLFSAGTQEEFRDHGGGGEKDTITLYEEGVHYEIDRESKECFVGPIPEFVYLGPEFPLL